MATDLANLQTAYSQTIARLVAVTASTNMTYTVDGETYNKTEYMQALSAQIEVLKKAIQAEASPFEVRTLAR